MAFSCYSQVPYGLLVIYAAFHGVDYDIIYLYIFGANFLVTNLYLCFQIAFCNSVSQELNIDGSQHKTQNIKIHCGENYSYLAVLAESYKNGSNMNVFLRE